MKTTSEQIKRYKTIEHRLAIGVGLCLLFAVVVIPVSMLLLHTFLTDIVSKEAAEVYLNFVAVSVLPVLIGAGVALYFARPQCISCDEAIARSHLSDAYCGKCGACFGKPDKSINDL